MKPFLIGLAVAVVVLAAGFLTPVFVPPATGPDTLQALRDAELARRQLHAYHTILPLVGVRSEGEIEQFKGDEFDFEALVEGAQEEFATLSDQFDEQVRRATASDRRSRMPSGLQAASTSPAGVRTSVREFERALRENQKLLTEAVRNSRSAIQADRNALGVGQVAGTVKLVEAGKLLADARGLRARLTTLQGSAFAAAGEWAAVRAERDYYGGLDVATVRRSLEDDLDEVDAASQESKAEVDRLASVVGSVEQTLVEVRRRLEEARTQRLSMEETGFIVGDDASFEAYREQYLELGRRLRGLQDQEHLLTFGGIQGGRVIGDDLLEGEIEGGESVVGLSELKRRLEVAEGKLERYKRAREALEDQMSLVGSVGEEAQAQHRQYAARLETLAGEVDQIRARMEELAQQAFEKESTALGAAREAATAFKGAGAAVSRWISDARGLQQEKDSQRINQRLKLIVGDDVAPGFASSAEAQAGTLLGRIHTERALGLAGYLDTLERIQALMPGSTVDTGTLRDDFATARDEAVSALGEARDIYERLAQRQTDRSWVHQASLATVYHLLWQIDEFNAAQHRSNLIDQLAQVVANRAQSPELQQQVKLHTHLTGGGEPTQPDEQEAGEEESPDEDADPNAD